jgi:hypothetical protein
MDQSRILAAQSQPAEYESTTEARITKLYELCLAREPSVDEINLGRSFLAAQIADNEPHEGKSPWDYGYGPFDNETGSVTEFHRLPHWTGSAWQGGDKLPDEKLGWATLNQTGGHPGQEFAVVRRWTAPADGTLKVAGLLKHSSGEGDGVRGTLHSSRQGRVDLWVARNRQLETVVQTLPVQAGDICDFIVDCRGDTGFDSFQWQVTLELQTSDERIVARSQEAMKGPGPTPLTPWEQYAQVLLLSNEFAFVD